MDSSIGEYSKLARSLKLIPATAQLANGINFELQSSIQGLDNRYDNLIKVGISVFMMTINGCGFCDHAV